MTVSDFDPCPASSAPARLAISNRRHVPRFALLMAAIALIATLVWDNPSPAAPRGGPGGDPGPDCAADITGSLTATPSTVDRESTSLTTTLAWSVVVPNGCSAPKLTLAGRTVGTSGQMALGISKTATFFLRLVKQNRDLAHATVTVLGDPGFITVSPGLSVTAEDIGKFNEQWMQPFARRQAVVFATSGLQRHDPEVVWGAGERMAAMVRMFDLTRDRRYLDHLHEFTQAALAFRDDLAPDRPLDQIRNKAGLPAWGGSEVNSGGLHHVDEIVSSLYAFPIAAFARIVAEDPSLQAAYGDDAVDYANRIIETVNFFLPQIHRQRAGDFIEATLTLPLEYRDRPTEADCTGAYNDAMNRDPGNAARWDQKRKDCRRLREFAGKTLPHNYNLTFSMVLIELSRVLDSAFYLHSPKHVGGAENLRDFLLQLISRQQRYFADRLNAGNLAGYNTCRQHFCWNYNDDLPSGVDPRPEDTDHGAMDMSYVGLAFRDYGRLNAAANRLHEPLTLAPERYRGLARTFVDNIAGGSNFNGDVVGRAGEPADSSNSRCEGWLELTRADAKVYQACHDVSLRIVDGRQPYLNIGNHSGLLANKASQPPP